MLGGNELGQLLRRQVHAQFSQGSDLSLEDVFFRATEDADNTAPPAAKP